MSRAIKATLFVTLACGGAYSSAQTTPTQTYTYDSRGHLLTVAHTGGRNNGVTVSLTTDPADNRTQRTVTGSSSLVSAPPTMAKRATRLAAK